MVNRRTGIAFVAGMVLSGALAPSTEAQQTSPYVRDLPNVFDGIARNLAGSPEVGTADCERRWRIPAPSFSTPGLTKNTP